MTDQVPDSEKEMLLRLRSGDGLALDYFYQRYSFRIYHKLIRLVKIEVIAEELLQDVFVKIWEKRHLIDPQQPFRSYLFAIARNGVVDFYRRLARDKKLEEEVKAISSEGYEHIEEHIFMCETRDLIHQAIEKLPAQQKRIFTLCKLEGKSYKDVGALLGISTSTVNNQLVQATKRMKDHFSDPDKARLLGKLT